MGDLKAKEYYADFVVVGGGMAGVSCAVTAARSGKKTILIEKEGCLGGTACATGVMQLLGGRFYDAQSDRIIRVVGGFFDEITDELISMGEAVEPDTVDIHNYNPYGWYPRMAAGIVCDVDRLKWILERKCLEAGVILKYYSTVTNVQKDEKNIVSVITNDKSGMSKFSAKLFADCTGDADLAELSGCPTEKGRAEDAAMCPATTIFYVDDVKTEEYVKYQNEHNSPKLAEIIEKLKKEGKWKYPYDIFIAIETPKKGRFMINTVRQTDVDGTSSESLTNAVIEGRQTVYELAEIMRKHFPGFENATVGRIFDRVGIRETRRIVARNMITLNDALNGASYKDTVASTTYNFDLPDPKKPSFDPMMGDAKNPNAVRKHTKIEIPYGALLPCGVDNLIVAGRCLGAEREVMGACRVMGPCCGMGQAAGLAAALAGSNSFSDVDVDLLRKELKNIGIIGI